jgi:hypothetical protein
MPLSNFKKKIKKKKKIVQYFGLLLIISSVSGCSDDILEEVTKGVVSDGTFWTSKAEAEMGIRAAYYKAGASFNGAYGVWQYVIEDIGVDYGVGGWFASSQYSNYSDWSSTSPDFIDWGIWNYMWRMIYDTNRILDQVPSIDMDDSSKSRILGEAYGLRALGYFTMLNWFGPMAEVTSSLEARNQIPRGTRDTNFTLIEGDLLAAIEGLPTKSELITMGEAEYGRLSKGAVQGLLVKVYLEQGKWGEASNLALEIINSNEYQLEPNYLDIFSLANEGFVNKEVLWPLAFVTPIDSDPQQSQVLQVFLFKAPEITSFNHFNNWGGTIRATNDFYNSFEPGDARKEGLFYSAIGATYINDPVMLVKYPADPASAGIRNGNDYPFIRYADILLMRAEALNNMGNVSEAVVELNKVRLRAKLPALNAANFGENTLRDHILNERRWELYFEGHGKRDMKRMNVEKLIEYIKTVSSDWQTKGAERYLLLPIPVNARNSNPLLGQNPGF